MVWTDPGSLSTASVARTRGGRQSAVAAPAPVACQTAESSHWFEPSCARLRAVPGVADPVQFASRGGDAFLQFRWLVCGGLRAVGNNVSLLGSRSGAGFGLLYQLLVGRGR